MNLGKGMKPVLHLLRGKRIYILQFSIEGLSFRRKLVVVVDQLAQQAGQKTQRQSLQRGEIGDRCFPRLGRIRRKLFGFKIARKHTYSNSEIGLPCASDGENPIIAPTVGTRSVDSTRRSKTSPSRTPAPRASIHVVRESVSPVR